MANNLEPQFKFMKQNDKLFFKKILDEPTFDPNVDQLNNMRNKSA